MQLPENQEERNNERLRKFKETSIINEIYSKDDLDKKIAEKRGFQRLSTRQNIFQILSPLSENLTEDNRIKSHLENLTNTKSVDKKISFVKALSFPPLSQYIKLHEYALPQLLNLLSSTLSSGEYSKDNLDFVKSLLKGLSALGSNALVRKDVIEGSWKFYTEFKKNSKEDTKFSAFLRFCIKNASYQDKAKSLWLGEYLRTGKEINVNEYTPDFKVSKFDYQNSPLLAGSDEDFRNCLLSMYYDNTTITRKALDDFETERLKDQEIRECFEEHSTEKEWRLKPFEDFKENANLDRLVEKYKVDVDKEYYYSWFKQLFNTDSHLSPDGIHYIQKLCLVLYARLFFKKLLAEEKQEASFDKNAGTLLQIFASIVDADEAFISIKATGGGVPFTLSTTLEPEMKGNEHSLIAPYFEVSGWNGLPLLIEPHLCPDSDATKISSTYKCACFLSLGTDTLDSTAQSEEHTGIVTFLYKNSPSPQEGQDYFIRKISNGRLLLLLKPETDEYVKKVSDGKQFKLWAEKQIFANLNDATKHELTLGMVSTCFETMSDRTFKKTYTMIDLFSNVVVRKLYGEFQRNGQISMDYSSDMTFNDVLEDRFIRFIKRRAKDSGVGGVITISPPQEETFTFRAHKYILQALIYQCILNARKFNHSEKRIDIALSANQLIIQNNFPNHLSLQSLKKDVDEFNKYYDTETLDRYRKGEINYRYGFTIISLYYYCESCKLKCNIDYNITHFKIIISRKNQ